MRIVFDTPAGARDVALRRSGAEVTVGALLAGAGAASAAGVLLDGHFYRSDLLLEEVGLYEGAWLSPAAGPKPKAPPASAALELRVIAGFDAGVRIPLQPAGSIVIGRDLACDLVVRDPRVSRQHCQLEVSADARQVLLTDLGSGNGTWLEGRRVEQPAKLAPESVFDVGDAVFTIAAVDARRDKLRLDPARDAGRAGTVPFNRPPRARQPREERTLEAPRAPVEPPKARFSVVSAVGPLVLGLVMVIALGNPLYALFMLLSPVMVVGSWYENRRRATRDARWQGREHAQAVGRFTEQVDTQQHLVRVRLRDALPDLGEILYRATAPSSHLWERRNEDDDFLKLSGGFADLRSRPALADRQAPDQHVEELLAAREVLPSVPVGVELAGGGVLGVVGPRRSALAAARALVCHAAVLHGPADLSIAVLTESGGVADWEWSKWLPHVRDPARGEEARLLAAGESEWQALADRLGQGDADGAALLLVLDGDGLLSGRSAVGRQLLRSEQRPSGVVIASSPDRLPAACTAVLEVSESAGDSRLHKPREGAIVERLVVSGASATTARMCALAIARFDDPELQLPGGALPDHVPRCRSSTCRRSTRRPCPRSGNATCTGTRSHVRSASARTVRSSSTWCEMVRTGWWRARRAPARASFCGR